MTRYTHTQPMIGSPGVMLLFVAGLALGDWVPGACWVGFGFVTLVLALLASRTTRIDGDVFEVSFGPDLVRRRVAVTQITSHRRLRATRLAALGHVVPDGWLWNTTGLDGVEVRLDNGAVWRVGTNQPEALCRALAEVVKGN